MDAAPLPAPTRDEVDAFEHTFDGPGLLAYSCWRCEQQGGNWVSFRGTNYRRTQTGDWEIAIEDD